MKHVLFVFVENNSGYPQSLTAGRWALCCVSIALLAGCGREEIRVYRAPKEKPASPEMAGTAAHSMAQHATPKSPPRLNWKLPEGWQETGPGKMSIASFAIAGNAGDRAEVSVMPMGGESAANLSMLVNIVRQGAGLEPIEDKDLAKLVEDIQIGDTNAKLVDLSGAAAASGELQKDRIMLALLPREGTTWFFKMAGSPALVSAQRNAFLDFLKSISFQANPRETGPVTSEASGAVSATANEQPRENELPQWKVPASWKPTPPTQMLLAKFVADGSAGATAEITVSSLAGEGGGLLANVNRWRGKQLGLKEVDQTELEKLVTTVEVMGGQAKVVDFKGTDSKTGKPARILAAVVPRAGQTWFYKMMGEETLVEREKEAFLQFVQMVKYPNAR